MDFDAIQLQLERMASISPGVQLHITGEFWRQQIDEDELDPQKLVNECFSVIIDEAYEIGLEFFCTKQELCDNLYHMNLTLLLFEVIFPTPLYRSIVEDDGFKQRLIATVIDGAGDPDETSIIDILNYLTTEHPLTQEIFVDTYQFLHDKLKSTPAFDIYVKSILDVDNIPFDVPVDTETLIFYHDHVMMKTKRLLKAIDACRLAELADLDIIQVQYNRLDIYRNNATDYEMINPYAWVLQMMTNTQPTPMIQALMVKYSIQFTSITPFFSDYFEMRAKPLASEDVLSLALGCLDATTTADAFSLSVDTVFARLHALGWTLDLPQQLLLHRWCLILMKECVAPTRKGRSA